jgi:ubiquinone/menaquinone biosynthesis C-methylase UbiE
VPDGPPDDQADGRSGAFAPGYFETRLAANPHRATVWRHVCDYLSRWIAPDAHVLELGAGWCDFANNVRAARVVAMDVDQIVRKAARDTVTAVVGDCTDLSGFDDASFDVVFASNLLEHLERPAAARLLAGAQRVLRPGGRLILVQPNFRLNPGGYFDDFTHVAIYTDRSVHDWLVSEGWRVEHVAARFLPLTMKSRASVLAFLVPLYIRSPIKPLAGQMLVVATPAGAAGS